MHLCSFIENETFQKYPSYFHSWSGQIITKPLPRFFEIAGKMTISRYAAYNMTQAVYNVIN